LYYINNIQLILSQASDPLGHSDPEDVLVLSTGVSAAPQQVCDYLIPYYIHLTLCHQHSHTAELLAHRLSRTRSVDQVNAEHVPLSLEERLRAANDLIDNELEELEWFRAEVNRIGEILLEHSIILCSVRDNFLRP
jgi:hypothetical protein